MLLQIKYFEVNEINTIKNDRWFVKIFQSTIRNNPRQVKQLVNFLKLTKLMDNGLLKTSETKVVYILLYLIQHTSHNI